MKEKFHRAPEQTLEKIYPPITRKELSSYKTPEDWLERFFKRYELIPQATTLEDIAQRPIEVEASLIRKRAGDNFFQSTSALFNDPRRELNNIVPGLSIKFRETKSVSYWAHLTEEEFREELIKRGIDLANPPTNSFQNS